MADELKHVHVIAGPYRDNRLSMTAADADAAIAAHWAVDPYGEYPGHEPLTDQQRTDALTAAHTWAKAQWDTAQGVTPKDEPHVEHHKRDMTPEEAQAYKTRQQAPSTQPKR